MNTIVIRRGFSDIIANLTVVKPLALAVVLGLMWYPETREIMLNSLSDAYFQVSVFVAATLFGMLIFERVRRRELNAMLNKHVKYQVVFAALFGSIPGCGGAIFVVTQYIRGSMSFGGVVATLTATMGDAAFLLLARAPADALLVFAVCLVMGVVCGYVVDLIHGRDFLRQRENNNQDDEDIKENPLLQPTYWLWMGLFLPGAAIGLAYAFQVDVNTALSIGGVDWVLAFGAAAALLALVMWSLNPLSDIRLCISPRRSINRRVIDTTNFITFWVLCGFVAYAMLEDFFHFDLASLFGAWIWFIPLIATLIGFIPGCGPQVVVTTLFLNGAIPLSAQMANAISNDGDALFPAVVIAPRASIIATMYTAIPALVVGYSWMFLFE
ncbi:MAG: putative manganese transporter [Gammaproteobacteria bacterium WSBS_2016_MAG_OTU1]